MKEVPHNKDEELCQAFETPFTKADEAQLEKALINFAMNLTRPITGIPMSTPDRKPCGCLKAVHCAHVQESLFVTNPVFGPGLPLTIFPSVDQTLSQRGSRYGDFNDNANLSQFLETTIRQQPGYEKLSNLHREALKFIFQKISRIVNGDPNYHDNWHDIQGYAKLVEDRLPKVEK